MEELSSSIRSHSRKRKKSSPSSSKSNPSVGILTRSKSQVYFHHNRSGVARLDPVFRNPIPIRLLKTRGPFVDVESVESLLELDCKNAARVPSIKDLRARRVFTPDVNSVLEEDEEEGKELLKRSGPGSDSNGVLDSDLGNSKVDEVGKSEVMLSEAQDERNYTENGPNLKDQARNGSFPKSKVAVNRCSQRKVFKTSSSFSYRRLLPYLLEIVNDDPSVSKIEIIDAGIPHKLQKLDGMNSTKVVPQLHDADHKDVSINKQDLSGVQNELGQSAEIIRPIEVEQKGYENDVIRVDTSVEEECSQMTPPDPDILKKTEVNHDGESMEANDVLAVSQKSNSDVLNRSRSGNNGNNSINRSVLNPCSRLRLFKNPRSLSYRRLLPFLMDISKTNPCASRIAQQPQLHVELKEELHPESASSDEQNHANEIKTETSFEKQHTEDGSCHDTNNSQLSSLPESSSANDSSNLEPNSVTSDISPRKSETDSDLKENSSANDIWTKQSASEELQLFEKQNICLNTIEKVDFNQSSVHTEVSDALVSSSKGPFKGILKRNRRGCRGLCNCLNCTSFRLHADRAFEFSRNQMHDAEEVAIELMKELTDLRHLLEESIINDNRLTAIHLNPVLVKQACNKSLETENLAKERLSQLNYDLNVHCKIPVLMQPKVSFANHIQERAIPVVDPSTNTERKNKVIISRAGKY